MYESLINGVEHPLLDWKDFSSTVFNIGQDLVAELPLVPQRVAPIGLDRGRAKIQNDETEIYHGFEGTAR